MDTLSANASGPTRRSSPPLQASPLDSNAHQAMSSLVHFHSLAQAAAMQLFLSTRGNSFTATSRRMAAAPTRPRPRLSCLRSQNVAASTLPPSQSNSIALFYPWRSSPVLHRRALSLTPLHTVDIPAPSMLRGSVLEPLVTPTARCRAAAPHARAPLRWAFFSIAKDSKPPHLAAPSLHPGCTTVSSAR
jgi:hypothetical protein